MVDKTAEMCVEFTTPGLAGVCNSSVRKTYRRFERSFLTVKKIQ